MTYEYAERVLLGYYAAQHAAKFPDIAQTPRIKTVYMIGDNPASDIAGADAF